jgi:hypothetical protein
MKRPGRIARAIRPGRSFSRKSDEALGAASLAAYCFGGVCDWSAGGVEPEAGGAPAAGAAAPD